MNEWTVRPVETGDEGQITTLFQKCFSRQQSVEQYRWKLIDVPWRNGMVNAWVADADGRIIGQYAGTPMPFKLGDDVLRVLHVCDVMTDPAYRRQGVLSRVGEAATAAWKEAGIAFVTGLHYGGWGSPRQRLGWEPMFSLSWLWRPLAPAQILARRLPLPRLALHPVALVGRLWNRWWDGRLATAASDLRVEEIARPGSAFDELWASLSDAYEALVVRDRQWVTYRYADAPGFGYHILLARSAGRTAGYLVYRVTGDHTRTTGWIVDLFVHPADGTTRAALLRAALQRMERAGADTARILLGAGTPMARALRRVGFLPARGAYDASIVPLAADMPYTALHNPSRWFTMVGDYDAI